MTLSHNSKHLHLCGVLGSGMTALACYLLDQGHRVSGSDIKDLPANHILTSKDIRFFPGQSARNIEALRPHELIYSIAVPAENPEREAARRLKISETSRTQKLVELAAGKRLLMVTGSHGKSTITSLIAYITDRAGMPVSYLIGAVPKDIPPGKCRAGEWLILEGDESNPHILQLTPELLLLSSLEWEHPERYTLDELKELFAALTAKPCVRTVIYNRAYPLLRALAANAPAGREWLDYAIPGPAHFYGTAPAQAGQMMVCRETCHPLTHNLFGAYNRENILAAFALSQCLGVKIATFQRLISGFGGLGKRMERIASINGAPVYIDFCHHPTEIRAAIQALRHKFRDKRVILVFEPHMPSRIKCLAQQFASALSQVDVLMVTSIFQARKDPNPDYTIDQLLPLLTAPQTLQVSGPEDMMGQLKQRAGHRDVVLIASAGPLADTIKEQVRQWDR